MEIMTEVLFNIYYIILIASIIINYIIHGYISNVSIYIVCFDYGYHSLLLIYSYTTGQNSITKSQSDFDEFFIIIQQKQIEILCLVDLHHYYIIFLC